MGKSVRWAGMLLLLGVVAACGRGEAGLDRHQPTMTGLPFSEHSHESEPFARELFNEQVGIKRLDDELVLIPGDYDGVVTNVRGHSRPGYVPAWRPVLDVWFFGGSTSFDIGQRDEHTIPSGVRSGIGR